MTPNGYTMAPQWLHNGSTNGLVKNGAILMAIYVAIGTVLVLSGLLDPGQM